MSNNIKRRIENNWGSVKKMLGMVKKTDGSLPAYGCHLSSLKQMILNFEGTIQVFSKRISISC